jgi:hypothetical protein
MKSLVYSMQVQDAPYIPENVDQKDIDKLIKKYEYTSIEGVTLNIEDEVFLESIKKQSPKERLYAIEDYVKSISYYDFNNGEVMGEKEDLTLEENLSFMSIRYRELASKNEDLKKSGKRYAGVCSDFAMLTTVFMQKAGLMAGRVSGSVPEDGLSTVKNAHSVSVALWPGRSGNKLVPIDGTPSEGINEEETKLLEEIRFSSLKEREKTAELIEEQDRGEVIKKIEEIERKLAQGEESVIEELKNGELEKMLNVVLKHQVKPVHVSVIKRTLDASRYSGLPVFSEDINDQIVVRKFLESEVTSERERSKDTQGDDAGTELFKVCREYIDLYKGDLGKIETVINLVDGYLDKIEHRAMMLLIKYLKAEKMKR